MKYIGETISAINPNQMIKVFECEKCKMRTRFPETHKCLTKEDHQLIDEYMGRK